MFLKCFATNDVTNEADEKVRLVFDEFMNACKLGAYFLRTTVCNENVPIGWRRQLWGTAWATGRLLPTVLIHWLLHSLAQTLTFDSIYFCVSLLNYFLLVSCPPPSTKF